MLRTPFVAVRSVGLASKAFIVAETIYFLAAFQSPYQKTYFLIQAYNISASLLSLSNDPLVTAKLAYENGAGYLTLGLPSVTVTNNVAQMAYLFVDEVAALNTMNPQSCRNFTTA